MSEFWKDRNVFITGGTGFIGTYVVQKLISEGANVFCLCQELPSKGLFLSLGLDKKTTLICGSVLDMNLINLTLQKHQIDTVFHLAAQPLVQLALLKPYETIETNIIGTLNVLESCRINKVKRIIVASTDKSYGSSPILPYDENYPLKGEFPYDVSKSCTDLISQSYGKTYGMPIAISRSANVFGGGDLNFDRIIPETVKSLLHDEPVILRSSGQFVREFFYVKDAAKAYLTLAEKIEELGLKGEAFNFGTDVPIKILDLVKKIKDLSGKNTEINILNTAKAEIKDQYLSSKKSREVLGWTSKYTLEQGLIETYEWYKNYFGK